MKTTRPTRITPTPNLNVKGYAGAFGYGYLTTSYTSNRWMVFDSRDGQVLSTELPHLSAAANLALRLNHAERAAARAAL